MATIEITAAKIVKKEHCSYTYEDSSNGGFQITTVDSSNLIHDDMRLAFRQLVPHLVLMCDEMEDSTDLGKAMDDIQKLPEQLVISETLQRYRVTSVKITGSSDNQGVLITGVKKLKSGKTITLNSPNYRWRDEYQYINELRIAVERVKTEVMLYSEGKIATEEQLSLFEEGDGMTADEQDEAI